MCTTTAAVYCSTTVPGYVIQYREELESLEGDLIPLSDSSNCVSIHIPLVNVMHVSKSARLEDLKIDQNSWLEFFAKTNARLVYDTGAELTLLSVPSPTQYEEAMGLLRDANEYTFRYKVFQHRKSCNSCWGCRVKTQCIQCTYIIIFEW